MSDTPAERVVQIVVVLNIPVELRTLTREQFVAVMQAHLPHLYDTLQQPDTSIDLMIARLEAERKAARRAPVPHNPALPFPPPPRTTP